MALSHYNLIPEAVYGITSVSTLKTNHFKMEFGEFIYRRIKPSLMFGYKLIRHDDHNIKIAEMEKAILDFFYLNPHLEKEDDFAGLRFNSGEFKAQADKNKIKDYLIAFGNKKMEKRFNTFLRHIKYDCGNNMKNEEFKKGEIVIYKAKGGPIIDVRLQQETVWLTQKQLSELFDTERSVITKHLRNIFNSGELEEKSNVQKMHIANSDKPVAFYNLDLIISVGYRVNSKRGTQFRIWATNVLRKHLVDGYTINEKRLKAQKNKIRELQEAVRLLGNIALLEDVSDEAKGIVQIISEYSKALNILDDFDHQRLTLPKGTKKSKYKLTYDEARNIIDQMRYKFRDSALVGQEKDKSFQGSIGAIYQTFDGKDVYPTIEEKAAHLLYFVTKNHSFVDGNKRIAAALFICFLQKTSILLAKDGRKRIDDNALVALTLMIAASKPSEKDIMIKVILNLLNEKKK
jgi:prophage maintenance system killer protein